jgi:2-dehydropantoate 2-reductase
MQKKSIAVLGVGGVGGCLAAVLAHKGASATCIDREETVEIIRTQGLALESAMFGSFTVWPAAETCLSGSPDILFVTTKATVLEQALDRIDPDLLKQTVIIPLLNGLEHVELIRRRLGNRVAAGSIRIESALKSPGKVVHSSPFLKIRIASDHDISRERLNEVVEFLKQSGVEAGIGENEASVLWEKLARLVALACTTALTDKPIGYIRSDSSCRGILEGAVKEAVGVAQACGVRMGVADQMKILDSMPESLTSSMQRDISAGRPSELDAIAGAVVRVGKRVGQDCSVIESLIGKIKGRMLSAKSEYPG